LVITATIAGCGTAAVDKTRLTTIHSVYIATVHDRRISVLVAMMDWSPLSTKTTFDDVLTRQGLHLGAEMHSAVADALKADGYQISPALADADAIVEARVTAADYVARPSLFGVGCTPIALLDVKVRNFHTDSTILSRTYRLQNGGGVGLTGDVLLPSDPKYDVDDCATLWSNPQLPVDAFRAALPELTRAVAADLVKPI
jgi:hypothetical protein